MAIKLDSMNNFDLVRITLSILVFFAHWNILTKYSSDFLFFHLSGVAIEAFFIISGFLIWWSFDKDRIVGNFYIKRFFRIFPVYGFVIIIQTLILAFFSDGSLNGDVKYFLSNIIFLNFLQPSSGSLLENLKENAINGSLWTLKNEVAFYLIVPLLYYGVEKIGIKILLLIFLVSVSYTIYFQFIFDDDFFYYSIFTKERLLILFPAQIRYFLVGVIFYIYFDKIIKLDLGLISILILPLVIMLRSDEIFRVSLYPFMLAIILFYLIYCVRKIVIEVDLSYSLYLVHFPIIQLSVLNEFFTRPDFLSFGILFCGVLVVSFFLARYIEAPFIKMGRKYVKKR